MAQESNNKPSQTEEIKAASNGLAGAIAETLASGATHLNEDDNILLKFHGSYQGDDRDQRSERKKQGLDRAFEFMIRLKLPGGRLTPAQYLALDELAELSAGALRLTSRQSVQFHHVQIEHLKEAIRRINDQRLTTLGACGDVNRNVMCCPVSDLDWRAGFGMQDLAGRLAAEFTPHSTAYWEIWCDGERWGEKVTPDREEPFYGKTYLPRKFKIGVGNPEDNCIDMLTQDLAFEAVHDGSRLLAWDVLVGGGMGFTSGTVTTFPRLASRMARIAPEDAIEVARAVVALQRDNGDRSNRKHARLKYLVEERGVEWVRAEVERRLGKPLADPGPAPQYQVDDHLGWREANDGTLCVGVFIPNGRIIDREGATHRTGLREIVRRFEPRIRVTPKADIVFAGIRPEDRAELDAMLQSHGLQTDQGLTPLRRVATACVALPTCNLALAEAERQIPILLEQLEAMGLGDAPVEIRMSGCANSCVRTTGGEIGLVGRAPGKYAMYLGGSQLGTRLAYLFEASVDKDQLAPRIARLIGLWREQANGSGVSFGDWAAAKGKDALAAELGA